MANCWKCGKEIHGFRESIIGFSTCPECETLEVLKKMQEEKDEERKASLKAWEEEKYTKERLKEIRKLRGKPESKDNDYDIDFLKREELPKVIFDSSDIIAPEWWKKAKNPKNSVAAGFLAFFFGEWGFPFMYIGNSWKTLGVGMFFIFVTLLCLYPIASCIYLVSTNFLLAVLFFCMDENAFLKRFRYDQWKDKQIADLYGHQVDEMGNYTDIPPQKPSWNEAFSQKPLRNNSNVSNRKEEAFHSNSSNESSPNTESPRPKLSIRVKTE